ncbi:MAG TPA: flagellar type III secretion system pore protein FliP [Nocardioidaceae bacterium]|nr:flagellar type III secretion system pore protein FliP [Nocardioidaceae bacterium]
MAEVRRAGRRPATVLAALVAGVLVALGALLLTAGTAAAAPVQATPVQAGLVQAGLVQAGLVQAGPVRDAPVFTAPDGPRGPNGPRDGGVTVRFDDITKKPSTPIIVLLGLTLLSLVPAILLTCTSFTKILVVLGLTRNALGLQQTPPNQVLAGLALFLSLFIMAPVLSQMNDDGLQPYLDGTKTQSQAWHDGVEPLRGFMLDQTGDKEIALLTEVAQRPEPQTPSDVPLSTLVPAFVLSELKQAFIIGFMIFIPFLVIDIVISGALMSLGMMMMPPVMVSLPFKLLLFVLVDGWALIVRSLVQSYTG